MTKSPNPEVLNTIKEIPVRESGILRVGCLARRVWEVVS